MGYIAGASAEVANGPVRLWVNGAFNSGNSGGPLVRTDSGEVVGVVAAKLAPIPDVILSAMNAMAQTTSGVIYNYAKPDGTTQSLTEAQVVSAVLQYLRGQTQLVIGMAVPSGDLAKFMRSNKVVP